MPSAIVAPPIGEVATRDGGEHRRPPVALHADDGHVRALGARHHGHAGEQAAAAGRHHQRVELGVVVEQLQRHRALTGDDRRVVVGVHERAALVGRAAGPPAVASPRSSPCSTTRGTEHLGALHLHERGVGGHHDGRLDAQPGGVARDGLGVVAGRHGHHTAPALVLGEASGACSSAPRSLKAAVNCRFSNFTTTPVPSTADRVCDRALGRALDRAGDALGGGEHVVERDVKGHGDHPGTTRTPRAPRGRGRRPCPAPAGRARRRRPAARGSARSGS